MKKYIPLLLILAMLAVVAGCDSLMRAYLSAKDEVVEDTLDYAGDGDEDVLDYLIDHYGDIENVLHDNLRDLERDTAGKYGLHPEEAAAVLYDYVDGKTVSKEELQTAIDSICGYYYDSLTLPDEMIDDIFLYID